MKSRILNSTAIVITLLLFGCKEDSVSTDMVYKPLKTLDGQWMGHSSGYLDWFTSITTSDNGITIDKLFFLGNYTKDGFIGYTAYRAETVKDSITLKLVNDTIHGSTKSFTKKDGIYQQTFYVEYYYTRVKENEN